MINKPILLVLCVLLLSAVATTATAQNSRAFSNLQSQSNNQVPKPIIYWHMFRHVVTLNKKAEEAEKRGENGAKYRFRYKSFARLTDREAQLLNQTAADCYQKVVQHDEKAIQIVKATRAKFPGGRLQPGQTPPPPSPELKQLQEERDRIIQEYYHKLQQSFSEKEFSRFDQFVEKNIGPYVTVTSLDSIRPSGRRQPTLLPPGSRREAQKQK